MQPAVVLALRDIVVYPGMLHGFHVGRAESVAAVERHMADSAPLVLVPQRDPDVEDPIHADLATVGVTAGLLRVIRMPDGDLQVLAEGLQRVTLGPLRPDGDALVAEVEALEPAADDPVEVGALARHVAALLRDHLLGAGVNPDDQALLVADPSDPERLADQVSAQLDLSLDERISQLEEASVLRRLSRGVDHLAVALATRRVGEDVNQRVQAALEQGQREFHLREQLKAIRAELGDAVGPEAEADAFEAKVRAAGMPAEVEEEALREIERLRRIHTDSAEYMISRTWLETLCDVPWLAATEDTPALSRAQRVLDTDHYGLGKVKERILEYLAVRQLNPGSKGPILCFVGPPGVGKTSLGQSIARALGRSFGRIALGGVRDETEIRGHRRTYVGSLPGRITRALIRAGTRNPVLVLDEIDKLGNDFRGDPSSALLEVLDPEQNHAFVDHYLDVPIDLSQVLFIATANLIDPIPAALQDRLEIIELPGYTEEEKTEIARRHLLPKLAEAHGLADRGFAITTKAIRRIIRDYTREAGLRDLERNLATLHRKAARMIVEGHEKGVRITDTALPRFLGAPRYFMELAERVDQPGVVIGLAWTATGGDILFVEAIHMPGPAALKLTGSLGDVMKESVEAAMSWLRAHAAAFGVDPTAFDGTFHLHVPAGAIPKDGPSAGVTMVTALTSLVTARPVKPQVAMTGEITLRGKVLPVGGVKEKVLAARRAGVRTVILPRHNAPDLEDIPDEIRSDLAFVLVDSVDDVLAAALVPA